MRRSKRPPKGLIFRQTRKIVFSVLCFFMITQLNAALLQQQPITVTGIVASNTGDPIPAATINEKGTNVATVSDTQGKFSIAVSNANAVLVISSVGFTNLEVPLNGRTNLDTIKLSPAGAKTNLEEVVVVGYGTQSKREITSAIVNVKAEDFNRGGMRNPMDLVQGKVAGLNLTRTQGSNPNSGTSIQLRGITSISGTNSPLVVVDGIPGGNLDLLQQDDIESISVLKDGSAAAIYGTRANGGVILVTTKKGKAGEPLLEFSTYLQREYVDKRPDNLSAEQFRELIREGVISEDQDFGANTDLFSELINKSNLSQYYNLAASGGTAKANYRGSIYYNKGVGIAKENDREQFGGRINFNQKALKDLLTMQMNLAVNMNKANLLGGGPLSTDPTSGDYSATSGADFEQAIQWNPTAPLYQPDGSFTQLQTFNNYNPLSRLANRIFERNQQTFSGDVKFILKLAKGLNASVFGSYLRNAYNDRYFRSSEDWDQRIGTDYQGMSFAQKSNYLEWTQTVEPTVDYTINFGGKHTIAALGGYSYQNTTFERFSANNSGFPSDAYQDWNLGAGAAINITTFPRPVLASRKEENTLIAFFGRVNYTFDNKYFLQAIIRHEGSSRFGANNKWANFPAVSAGWTITNEEFMSGIPVINNLKLRAGYGVTGNQGIPNYRSLYLLGTGGVYPQNGVYYQTFGLSQNPNPNLQWEKKGEFNVGLDFALLDNRLNGSFDVFNRNTSNLLYSYFVPQPDYVQGNLLTNVGNISGKGVELWLSGKAIDQEHFKWTVEFTGSSSFNRLAKISSENFKVNFLEYGGLPSPGNLGNAIRISEGSFIGDFYGKRFAGFTEDGKWQFYKADGSIGGTGDMTEQDRTVIGNGVPRYQAAIGNRFTYHNFDLTVFFRGKFKFDILNTKDMYFGNKKWLPNNLLASAIGKHAALDDDPQYSDYYLEKGDFVKLDNVTLGYNLNFKNDYVKRCYFYLTGRNLLTFTGYSGLDPELQDVGFATGIDNRSFYPRTKSITIGLNIGF